MRTAFAVALLLPHVALAQAFDPKIVEEGMRLYKSTGADCEWCHAWQGSGMQHNMLFGPVPGGGPSLVKSTMDRAAMIAMVSCGKLTGISIMPRYRGEAWTAELPCHGKTRADIPPGEYPVQGNRMLNAREVEAVVTFIQAVYQGKGMSLAECLKYWAQSPRACDVMK